MPWSNPAGGPPRLPPMPSSLSRSGSNSSSYSPSSSFHCHCHRHRLCLRVGRQMGGWVGRAAVCGVDRRLVAAPGAGEEVQRRRNVGGWCAPASAAALTISPKVVAMFDSAFCIQSSCAPCASAARTAASSDVDSVPVNKYKRTVSSLMCAAARGLAGVSVLTLNYAGSH